MNALQEFIWKLRYIVSISITLYVFYLFLANPQDSYPIPIILYWLPDVIGWIPFFFVISCFFGAFGYGLCYGLAGKEGEENRAIKKQKMNTFLVSLEHGPTFKGLTPSEKEIMKKAYEKALDEEHPG